MTDEIKFPRGIEIITGVLIRNNKGEILFTRSPKWPDVITIPGGHVEPGETIIDGAKREAKEETGLDVKFVTILSFLEMINPFHFHRPGHFIAFNVLVDSFDDNVKLDDREIASYQWLNPQDVIIMKDLAPTVVKPLQDYLKYSKKNHGN